jgi:hypothetical protein
MSVVFYDIHGNSYRRIYHSHIKKCAGTSLNKLIIGMQCEQDPILRDRCYEGVCGNDMVQIGDWVFTSHRPYQMATQKYTYAFSHYPYWELRDDFRISFDETFVFTTFRDPVERVISHYKMVKQRKENDSKHASMKVEGKWLGDNDSLMEFVHNLPKKDLMAQIYCYSRNYNIDEALENIKEVNFTVRVEDLTSGGYDELKRVMPALKFPNQHLRKSKEYKFDQKDVEYIKEMLQVEYDLLDQIKYHF